MSFALHWFSVCLSVKTVPPDAAHRAATEMQEELNARSHLRNTSVPWNGEREVLIVHLEAEFFDAEEAGDALAEELQEIAMAMVVDFEYGRVDLLTVDALEH